MQHAIRMVAALALAASAAGLHAREFKKQEECVVGAKVADRENKVGTVTGVSNSMCDVRLADGTKRSYLFWMLREAGASTVTDDKLVKGTYPCYGKSGYLFMDVNIESGDAYSDKKGNRGKYQLDAKSGKIVFTSGPLKEFNAKLLVGPSIGLNTDGGTFYSVSCGLKK